jgi:AraC-like DNA-binding protein
MKKTVNISFEDIIKEVSGRGIFEEDLFIQKINCSQLEPRLMPPVRLNAILLFLCKDGEISLTVDYKEYRLRKNTLLWVTSLHIVDNIVTHEHLEGYEIIMSMQFAKSLIDGIQGIKKLVGDGSRPSPVAELEEAEMQGLMDIVERIIKIQGDASHAFQRYIVKNEVSNLIFEILNSRVKRNKNQLKRDNPSRGDEVFLKFLRLLLINYREHHEVSFYAGKLCMTAGNLSRIMKAFSGKTAVQWINEGLVSEAKTLLRTPDATVQQIADDLHFGDQSSFGKFFKKHTGLTPREYKKRIKEEKE